MITTVTQPVITTSMVAQQLVSTVVSSSVQVATLAIPGVQGAPGIGIPGEPGPVGPPGSFEDGAIIDGGNF